HVDDQLEFGRLHHRQIGRPGTFEDLSYVASGLTIDAGDAGSIAQQAASINEVPELINSGHRVTCRQRNKLDTSAGKKGVGTHNERVRMQLIRERRIDFSFIAGFNDIKLNASRAHRLLSVFEVALRVRPLRVNKHCNDLWVTKQLREQLKPLWDKFEGKKAHAGQVALWMGDADHKLLPNGIASHLSDDRDRGSRVLHFERHDIAAAGVITSTLLLMRSLANPGSRSQ